MSDNTEPTEMDTLPEGTVATGVKRAADVSVDQPGPSQGVPSFQQAPAAAQDLATVGIRYPQRITKGSENTLERYKIGNQDPQYNNELFRITSNVIKREPYEPREGAKCHWLCPTDQWGQDLSSMWNIVVSYLDKNPNETYQGIVYATAVSTYGFAGVGVPGARLMDVQQPYILIDPPAETANPLAGTSPTPYGIDIQAKDRNVFMWVCTMLYPRACMLNDASWNTIATTSTWAAAKTAATIFGLPRPEAIISLLNTWRTRTIGEARPGCSVFRTIALMNCVMDNVENPNDAAIWGKSDSIDPLAAWGFLKIGLSYRSFTSQSLLQSMEDNIGIGIRDIITQLRLQIFNNYARDWVSAKTKYCGDPYWEYSMVLFDNKEAGFSISKHKNVSLILYKVVEGQEESRIPGMPINPKLNQDAWKVAQAILDLSVFNADQIEKDAEQLMFNDAVTVEVAQRRLAKYKRKPSQRQEPEPDYHPSPARRVRYEYQRPADLGSDSEDSDAAEDDAADTIARVTRMMHP